MECAHQSVYTSLYTPTLSWEEHLHVSVCKHVPVFASVVLQDLPCPSTCLTLPNQTSADSIPALLSFPEGHASSVNVRGRHCPLPVCPPLAVLRLLFSSMPLVNHYLPFPLGTGGTDPLTSVHRQTAFNTRYIDPCCCVRLGSHLLFGFFLWKVITAWISWLKWTRIKMIWHGWL